MNHPSPPVASSSSSTAQDTYRSASSSSSSSRSLKRSADELEPHHQSTSEPVPPAKRARGHSPVPRTTNMQEDNSSIEVDEKLTVAVSESLPEENGNAAADKPAVDETVVVTAAKADKFLEDMEEELLCGCCAALLYQPVLISPCGHYFCGACVVSWVRNGGTSCPACRQVASSVTHSRLLQGFIDVLLRTYPEKQRLQAERDQADDVYSTSMNISIPPPKPAQPEGVLLPQSRSHDPPPDNLARPCSHCLPGNEFGWRCPRPLADPTTDPEHAWNLDNGTPPGHAWCGTCDELHPIGAPSTTRCSICTTSFCGLSMPHLCVANYMSSAHLPVSVSSLSGIIQSLEVYEAFSGNTTEVEVLFDWLREDGRGPRGILFDMIEEVQRSPGGFQRLMSEGIFSKQGDGASELGPPRDDSLEPDVSQPDVIRLDALVAETEALVPVPVAPVTVPATESAVPADPPAEPRFAFTPPPPAIEDQTPPAATAVNDENTPPAPAAVDAPIPTPPIPQAIRTPAFDRICRECSHELFLARLYDWWARQRTRIIAAASAAPPRAASPGPPTPVGAIPPPPPPANVIGSDDDGDDDNDNDDDGDLDDVPVSAGGNGIARGLPEWVTSAERKDCAEGRMCPNQHSPSHAKEFNHIIYVQPADTAPPPPPAGDNVTPGTTSEAAPPAGVQVVEYEQAVREVAEGNQAGVDRPIEEPQPGLPAVPSSQEAVDVDMEDAGMRSKADIMPFPVEGQASSQLIDQDTAMEDASDTAIIERTLIDNRVVSSPPPSAGAPSMVTV